MTFLSITWKKTSEEHVPDLTRSSSEETPIGANACIDDSFESFHTAVLHDIQTPPTPEGLRPRPSKQELRDSLGLPTCVLQQLDHMQAATMPAPSLPVILPCLPPIEPASPMVTRSYSFYSRSTSSTMVAESPNFNPGQTLTAVGALLAFNEQKGNSRTRYQHESTSILPPMSVLPPRNWVDEPDDDESEPIVGYHHLNDSMDTLSPSRVQFVDQATGSPGSTTASSFYRPSRVVPRHTESGAINMSFSSQLGLVEFGKGMHLYNFDSIVVGPGDQFTNVSAISQSMYDDFSYPSMDSAKNALHHNDQPIQDTHLIQRKHQNQRISKEKVLLDVVARLQSDLQLVDDVEQLHDDNDDVAQWLVKTPLDHEGLLTGYSHPTRAALLKYFQSLLLELDIAQPEEFFMSPTQMEGYGETHSDLRQAAAFMMHLIKSSPHQRWVCHSELRSAMGIPIPYEDSETIRGGDTSLFSLPSESTTPQTTNVSMTSTISTNLSPNRRSKKHMEEKASSLRRTTEIFATILQKMTLACNSIARKENMVRATEDVKRNYMQLMSLDRGELITFVDAFVLESLVHEDDNEPPMIVRQVSNDDGITLNHYLLGDKCNMFSPTTEDMRTATVVEEDDEDYEYDDLRRTVGSNDYDGGEMERDAPEYEQRECDWDEGPMQSVRTSICH